ncbi:MAG: hypothetical protein B7Z37_30810 [Verrucomicrobia bacterium 12-59-8]|nr:MAG: hypothetical protein B7Z37_30810 [Verrucomicrobia bacterium 12-59-8]
MPLPISIHLGVTWMLVGLIWVVQILVYPQFHKVAAAQFTDYHFAHCFRMALIIAPLLFTEIATSAWLLYAGQRTPLFVISLGLIPFIWLCTAAFQAPMHIRLMRGFDAPLIRRLILTNWIRTLAWTARGIQHPALRPNRAATRAAHHQA